MKKVSFDFDATLSRITIQEFASQCIKYGHEVWVVTSRNDDKSIPNWIVNGIQTKGNNDDLFEVTDNLGIPRNQIIFTNHDFKSSFFKDKDFLFHIDDDWIELKEINKDTKTVGISCFGNKTWKHKAMKLLTK